MDLFQTKVTELKRNGFVLVESCVELSEEKGDFQYDVYYFSPKRGYTAISPDTNRIHIYGLSRPLKEIISNHKEEILKYRLHTYGKDAKVTAGDVFMWDGGYLTKLTTI